MSLNKNFYGNGGETIKTITVGSSYNPKQKYYKLCKDAYTGHGGFCEGEHLFKFRREEDEDFELRKEQAYYLNLVGPIVDSVVKPVFAQEIARTYDQPLFDPFVKNADGRGASLTDFTNMAVTEANVLSQAFVVMDSFPEEEIPNTLSEQVNQRKVPFVELKSPMDVRAHQVDRFGKIESITFFHGKKDDHEVMRRYDSEYIVEFIKNNDEEIILNKVEHGLGSVPVIQVMYGDILPMPELLSLAQAARTLYNQLSELRELSRDSSFSLLVVPGNDPKVILEVGPKNALFVPQNVTNMPSYISPDQAVNKSLVEELQFTVENILAQGELKGASVQVSTSSTVKSGVALAIEFQGNTDALNANADIAEGLEVKIAELFGLYTVPFEYEVTYARDFTPFSKSDMKEQFAFLKEALSQNLSPEINMEIKLQMLELIKFNTSINNDRYNELKETIQLAIESAEDTDIQELEI
jgi:hypothetical protein